MTEPRSYVVRLPYALVPGMDVNSRLFHKALATIAKQQRNSSAPPVSTPTASKSTVSENKALFDSLFSLEQGISPVLSVNDSYLTQSYSQTSQPVFWMSKKCPSSNAFGTLSLMRP